MKPDYIYSVFCTEHEKLHYGYAKWVPEKKGFWFGRPARYEFGQPHHDKKWVDYMLKQYPDIQREIVHKGEWMDWGF